MDAVAEGFDRADRGQMIMACGTGKTLAALFINEKLASRNRIRPAEPLASCRRRTGVRHLHKVDARRQL
jgi:predicted helicase